MQADFFISSLIKNIFLVAMQLLEIYFSCGAVVENIFLVVLLEVIIYWHYLLKYILVR